MKFQPNYTLEAHAVRPGRRHTLHASALVFVVLLLALAARWHGIAAKPFWMDEITTVQRASLPLGRLIANALTFHQLPSYFIVTSWVMPFGTDEAWVRSPAMAFGALSAHWRSAWHEHWPERRPG